MKTNQKGFAMLEGLLILLIIGILVGTGYYVWHTKQQTDTTLASAQSESTVAKPVKKPTAPSSKQNSTPTQQKYLDIKELGIKIPVPDSLTDLTYIWTDSDSEASLRSEAQLSYMKAQDPNCASDHVGTITTASPSPQPNNWAYKIKVEQTTYYYLHNSELNCDPSETGSTAAVGQASANSETAWEALQKAQAD